MFENQPQRFLAAGGLEDFITAADQELMHEPESGRFVINNKHPLVQDLPFDCVARAASSIPRSDLRLNFAGLTGAALHRRNTL